MKTPRFFITGILCLVFSVQLALGQSLNTRITIKVKDATLPQVLQQIQQKYGYRFSYLNNELPTDTKFSAEIKNKPFSEVLDVLLEKTDLGYRQTKGQIIIKKGFPKNKPKSTTFQNLPAPAPEKTVAKTPEKLPEPKEHTKEQAMAKVPANPEPPKPEIKQAEPDKTTAIADKTTQAEPQNKAADSTGNVQEPAPATVKNATISSEKTAAATTTDTTATAAKKENFLDKLTAIKLKNEQKPLDSDSVTTSDFHIGLTYPISTNGTSAPKFVNTVSAHLLIGSAAGLDGVEFAGFGNVEKAFVHGVQFAGFFNVAANHSDLYRATNRRNDGYTVRGAQFAGFFNLANGTSNVAQFAGFMNVTAGNLQGGQFGGFLNISRDVNGAQGAGFMNLANEVKGAQLAGFLNIAEEVSGAQVAGFLNVARHFSGVQVGVINLADSASGVPIGLLNYVHNGGYKKLEVYTSDDFQANLTFKLGVQKFHTLLALGAELDAPKRYGYGYGFGSEWQVSKLFRLNTDLMSYHVVEDSYENFPRHIFRYEDLNLLNKFRLLGTFQLAKHLAIFGGPTYNVLVSQYQEPGSEQIGSTLPNHTFYDHTSGNTNVKMWIGFNAGLRF